MGGGGEIGSKEKQKENANSNSSGLPKLETPPYGCEEALKQ